MKRKLEKVDKEGGKLEGGKRKRWRKEGGLPPKRGEAGAGVGELGPREVAEVQVGVVVVEGRAAAVAAENERSTLIKIKEREERRKRGTEKG